RSCIILLNEKEGLSVFRDKEIPGLDSAGEVEEVDVLDEERSVCVCLLQSFLESAYP
ncbi:MAG: hypothetical protein H6Q41_1563, partial [Deltaproteobacteria bacterium]|nr:hypothetical protein [Deltaproteobacteria bacterium]